MSPNKLWYFSVKRFYIWVWPWIIEGMLSLVTFTLLECHNQIGLNNYCSPNLVRSMLCLSTQNLLCHLWDFEMRLWNLHTSVSSPLGIVCRIYWTFQELVIHRYLWCKLIEMKFVHYWIMKFSWMCEAMNFKHCIFCQGINGSNCSQLPWFMRLICRSLIM